jgi:FkbM family methyltransferase
MATSHVTPMTANTVPTAAVSVASGSPAPVVCSAPAVCPAPVVCPAAAPAGSVIPTGIISGGNGPATTVPVRFITSKTGMQFLWIDGPESTQAIENWFNEVEESGVAVYHKILTTKRARRDSGKDGGPEPVVIDIGCHQGYFMAMAGKIGFKAIGFDMQPTCVRLAYSTMLLNSFQKQTEIFHRYVTTRTADAPVSPTKCSGGTAPNPKQANAESVLVQPIHAGNALLERDPNIQIAYIKIDVEGYEPIVLDTLEPLLAGNHGVDAMMMEITPKNYPDYELERNDALTRFKRLFEVHGFKHVYKLPENVGVDVCAPPASWVIADFAAFKTWLETDNFAINRFVNALFLKSPLESYCKP